jgi:hypothetical protein
MADINSGLSPPYYGVEGNDKRVEIMSIDRTTAKDAELRDASLVSEPISVSETVPNAKLRVLALELEDDNFGGDPYNSTGQFCQLELKDRD